MEQILIAVLSGGVVVAVIEGVKEAFAWRRNRKAQKEDRAEEKEDKKIEDRISSLEADVKDIKGLVSALAESQKNILYDRVKYLCREYIADGEIDFDDLVGLNALHHSYHFGLGGNGDLDALMEQARKLPIKTK